MSILPFSGAVKQNSSSRVYFAILFLLYCFLFREIIYSRLLCVLDGLEQGPTNSLLCSLAGMFLVFIIYLLLTTRIYSHALRVGCFKDKLTASESFLEGDQRSYNGKTRCVTSLQNKM